MNVEAPSLTKEETLMLLWLAAYGFHHRLNIWTEEHDLPILEGLVGKLSAFCRRMKERAQ